MTSSRAVLTVDPIAGALTGTVIDPAGSNAPTVLQPVMGVRDRGATTAATGQAGGEVVVQLAADLARAQAVVEETAAALSVAVRPHVRAWLDYLSDAAMRAGSAHYASRASTIVVPAAGMATSEKWSVTSVGAEFVWVQHDVTSVHGGMAIPLGFIVDRAAWIATDQTRPAHRSVAVHTHAAGIAPAPWS